jgi:12-oxophytodienoic acid reductase
MQQQQKIVETNGELRYIYLVIACSTGYQPDGQPPISCTDKPISALLQIDGTSAADYPPPRRLRTDEILKVVNDFRIAAKNAMEAGNS